MRKIIKILAITSLLGLTDISTANADAAADPILSSARILSKDASRSRGYKIHILVQLMERLDQSQLESLHKQTLGIAIPRLNSTTQAATGKEEMLPDQFDRNAISHAIAKRLLM